MRFLCIALLLLCMPFNALAQSASVSAGDHGSFTRLVFPLAPPNAAYQVFETSEGFLLGFVDPAPSYDFSNVFSKISTKHLRSLKQVNDKQVNISLNCTCTIDSFRWKNTHLVLDIKPAPKPVAQASFAIDPEQTPFRETDTFFERNSWQIKPTIAPRPKAKTPEPTRPTVSLNLNPQSTFKFDKKPVVDGILRATSQGLLEPARQAPQQNQTSPTQSFSSAANIRIQTTMEATTANSKQVTTNDTCSPAPSIDIQQWATEEEFDKQLAQARLTLVSDLEPQADALLKLAKIYLYFGFGAEARATLQSLPLSTTNRDILIEIANIIDAEPKDSPYAVSNFIDCDAPIALWAILATHNQKPEKTAAILNGFLDLPHPLKTLLAPRLSQALLDADKPEAAAKVLTILERSAPQSSSEMQLANAEVLLATDQGAKAQDLLEEVAKTDSPSAPAALSKLILGKFDRQEPISLDLAEQAETLAIELRGQADGAALQHTHILARISQNNFPKALEAWNDLPPDTNVDTRSDLFEKLTYQLVQQQDDTTFLTHGLGSVLPRLNLLTTETSNAVAKRFLSLGLTDTAQDIVAIGADGAIGRERRLLRAEINLAQQNPRQAQANLLGLNGQDVDELRAQAYSQIGDHENAAKLYKNLGDNEKSEQAAWSNSDWPTLQSSQQETLKAISDLMIAPKTNLPDAQPPSLALSRDLLTDSLQARETLNALLESNQLDFAMEQAE